MMVRVCPTEVNRIYAVADLNTLDTFIDTASLIVTEELAAAGLTAARLKQIELYLAAHYAIITLEKGGLSSQKIGDSEDTYKSMSSRDVGLSSTRFGQQAVALDTSGTLSALSTNSLKAVFRVM